MSALAPYKPGPIAKIGAIADMVIETVVGIAVRFRKDGFDVMLQRARPAAPREPDLPTVSEVLSMRVPEVRTGLGCVHGSVIHEAGDAAEPTNHDLYMYPVPPHRRPNER
jgi:hypothetical protein